MVLMMAIQAADNLDEITLSVDWSYSGKKQFLDATCFVYNRASRERLERIDIGYHNEASPIQHKGDNFPEGGSTGSHTIEISLGRLPANYERLYLTISAYKADRIGAVIRPTVRLSKKSAPTVPLCPGFAIEHAQAHQAIVMCFFDRVLGGWEVVQCGTPAKGDIQSYPLIEETLLQLL